MSPNNFNPDRCFVLLLEDIQVAFAEERVPLFSELRAVVEDSWLLTLSSEIDNQSKLNDLIWWTGEGKLDGILVVVFPDGTGGPVLYRLLTVPSNRGMVTLEQTNQSANAFKRYPYHNGLALADRYGKHNGRAFVVAEPPNVSHDHFNFKIVAPCFVDAPFFHTHLAYRRFNFVRFADERKDVYGIDKEIDVAPLVQGCGKYGVLPVQIYSDWLHQEFEDKTVASAVLNLAGKAFPIHVKETKPAVLPYEWQVTLGAMRLARRMATWALEGECFECSILLTDKETCELLKSGRDAELTRLFAMSSPLPFDFAREREVRFYAEAAQSDEILLVVDVSAGHLRDIAVANVKDQSPSRHDRFTALARGHRIVIHVRTGYVEVYVNGTMELWHDGFRWNVRPFDSLERIIRTHFTNLGANEQKATRLLVNAVAMLMDRQQGSTIVLLHETDDRELSDDEFSELAERNPRENETKTRFNILAGTSLRTELSDPVRQHVAGIDITQLPLGPLASILRLDGAHSITQDGKLKYIARRINVREEDLINEPTDSAGTGTRATCWVSSKLPESVAIRVSASGYLKIFKNGREVRSVIS